MEKVRPVIIRERKPGRPRAVPEAFESVVVDFYEQGYGYRAIARILNSPEYGLNPHFSTVRKTLIRLGRVVGR